MERKNDGALEIHCFYFMSSFTDGSESDVDPSLCKYSTTGSLRTTENKRARTLRFNLEKPLYPSSAIFLTMLVDRASGQNSLLDTVRIQVANVRTGLRSGQLRVTLVPGNIITLATTLSTSSVSFDVINCSNVADYTSLTTLLQAVTLWLKFSSHARLLGESIVVYGGSQLGSHPAPADQFERSCMLELPLHDVLGLKFVRGQRIVGHRCALRMEWKRAKRCNLPEITSTVTHALNTAIKEYCQPRNTSSSPTDVTILRQLTTSIASPMSILHLLCLAEPAEAEQSLEKLLKESQ